MTPLRKKKTKAKVKIRQIKKEQSSSDFFSKHCDVVIKSRKCRSRRELMLSM